MRYFYSNILSTEVLFIKENYNYYTNEDMPVREQPALTKDFLHIPETHKLIRVPKYDKYNNDESKYDEYDEILSHFVITIPQHFQSKQILQHTSST